MLIQDRSSADTLIAACNSAPPHTKRLAGVEMLRVLACFGIVWFHQNAPAMRIAYGGLPAFMIISIAFAATINANHSNSQIIASRFRRMGIPWLFWSAIYALVKVMVNSLHGDPPFYQFAGSMLLSGTALHLWYLPFGMVMTACVGLASANGIFKNTRSFGLACMAMGALSILACSWLLPLADGIVPLSQWIFIFPAISIGLSLAAITPGSRTSLGRLFVAMVSLVLACLLAHMWISAALALPFLVGIIACVIAWAMPFKAPRLLVRIASLSLGIYLIHPLVLSLLAKSGIVAPQPLLVILGFAFSAALTRLLQLTPLRVSV